MIGGYIGKPIGGIVNTGLTSLNVTTGSYAITGQSAAFKASVAITAGSYTISGQAIAFVGKIPVTAGSYALTGQTAAFAIGEPVTAGSYAITGQAASIPVREPVTAGAYTITGNAAALSPRELAAFGTYAITGFSIAFTLAMPVASAAYTITGKAAPFILTANGSGGEKRKRVPTRTIEIRAHDRKITVTDRDGKQRKVSYTKRFKPPPPLEEVPDWFLPQAPQPQLEAAPLVPQAPLAAQIGLQAPPPHVLDLADLRDEEDILSFIGMQDPLIADVALALAALVAAEQMGRP